MLEKLFESLDEKVFTPEMKEQFETQFNEAVETKASLIAEEKIEDQIDSLNEKSEEHIEMLNEKSEEHIEFLEEKAEEYVELQKTEMLDSIDKYLDRVVEEFMVEAKDSLDESVKTEKADMIIEAFDAMLVATGVKVATIVEAKDDNSVEAKLEESVEKYDTVVDENITLKEENEKLIKMGVIAESKEGLSIVEAEKFDKLANLVEFTRDVAFAEKLDTIKESVKGSTKVVEEEIIQENEEKSVEKIVESKKTTVNFDHLI